MSKTIIDLSMKQYPNIFPNQMEVLEHMFLVLGNGIDLDDDKFIKGYPGMPMGCDTDLDPIPLNDCYPFYDEKYYRKNKGCRNPGFRESIEWFIKCLEASDPNNQNIKGWLDNLDVLRSLYKAK